MSKIYGIDLGTTNSLIAYKDEYISDLIPSIVDIDNSVAGESQRSNPNAVRSFKVNISMSLEGSISRVASSHVLKELKRQVKGEVQDVVISVPAYFKDNQRQATIEAAKIAGLNVVALINEPTAAAMYVSREYHQLSLVFDLGGGTFDVSVIDSRFDNYDVQATDGLILGGDNLDLSIFRYLCKCAGIKVHHMSQQSIIDLKNLCTELKIRMQKERKDITVDLSKFGVETFVFPEQAYIDLMKMTFGKTIEKTKDVIAEAIPFGEEFDIILVGGSTRCPYLRDWITTEIGQAPVELFYDPDKVVAQGAAFYAQMLEEGTADIMVSDVTTALSIGLSDGTVRVIIDKNSKLPISNNTMVYNDVASDEMKVDIYQGDSMLASGNEHIGTVVYNYGEVKEALEGSVIIEMSVDKSGVITFSCKEMLKEPVVVKLERDGRLK